jgi:hypothetical protein
MSPDFASRIAPNYTIKLAALAALFLGCGAGCGAQGAGTLPDLIPVKGKVSLNGQPLTTGTIRFEPDDFGRPASGKLQSDGTFVLTTTTEGDGVVAGHHRVSITNISPKSKEGALLKKYTSGKTAKPLEADVSAEQFEFTFDIR